MRVAFCLMLLCFSFSLDLLSDESLFLFKLSGPFLSQPGDLMETTTYIICTNRHTGLEWRQIMYVYSSISTDVIHHLYGFHIIRHPSLQFSFQESVQTTLFFFSQGNDTLRWDRKWNSATYWSPPHPKAHGQVFTCIKHTEHMPWLTVEARTPFLFIIGFPNKVHQVMQYHLMRLQIIVIWQWKKMPLSDRAFVPDPSLWKISTQSERSIWWTTE